MTEKKLTVVGVMKEEVKTSIEDERSKINAFLAEKNKLPECIVQGSLENVIKYKETAAAAMIKYHVLYAPGESHSLKKFKEILSELTTIRKTLIDGDI